MYIAAGYAHPLALFLSRRAKIKNRKPFLLPVFLNPMFPSRLLLNAFGLDHDLNLITYGWQRIFHTEV